MTDINCKTINQSSVRPVRRSQRGQALLLAVLMMMFVALLGVTFVTVVALNLEQTGRAEDKAQAKQAARAGLEFAEHRITNSPEGLQWNPLVEVDTPVTANDSNYYTPLEIAQGWGNANPPFVKWPDPRVDDNKNAPRFLLQVEKVDDTDPDAATKLGALRITAIGLSPTNQNVFERAIAYKGGYRQMPLVSAARSVTNWDFDNGVVPRATVSGLSGSVVSFNNELGKWPATPFHITIGGPTSANGVRYAIVTKVDTSTKQLTLSANPSPAPAANERIEVAAALGAPNTIDHNNDGTLDPVAERVNFAISQAVTPGSALVNGGLIWFGNVFARNLIAPDQASTTEAASTVQASGLFVTEGTTPATVASKDTTRLPDTQIALNSAVADFPGNTPAERTQLAPFVDDGWNRIVGNDTATVRQVSSFTPPDITAGEGGVARYRQLSKYSDPAGYLTSPIPPQAAAFGYGEGIYINNAEDIEKVYQPAGSGQSSQLRAMTQTEVVDMLLNPDESTSPPAAGTYSYRRHYRPHLRTTLADAASNIPYSLEEQHLRGWISPTEFLPRGVLVEINYEGASVAPTVTITRDVRRDGIVVSGLGDNIGPADTKVWDDPSGAPRTGVYRQTFPWPANGVIFAEGNIRIRGRLPDTFAPPSSLTVVSMNNIYIEDSVGIGTGKLALMAHANVIVNPTRVLGWFDGQTYTTASTAGSGTTIDVADVRSFQPGDWIHIDNPSPSPDETVTHRVVSITPAKPNPSTPTNTAGTITFTPALDPSTTVPIGRIIRTRSDALISDDFGANPQDSTTLPYYQQHSQLNVFDDAIQRRFQRPANIPSGADLRIALRHSAERRPALRVRTGPGATEDNQPNPHYLRFKPQAALGPIVDSSVKYLQLTHNDPAVTPDPQLFPATPPADDAAAINLKIGGPGTSGGLPASFQESITGPLGTSQWQYLAEILNPSSGHNPSVAAPADNYELTPFYFLAGVGNRSDTTDGSSTFPFIKNIAEDKNADNIFDGYDIPVGTSVAPFLNGNPSWLSLHPGATAAESVRTWGISPYFNASSTSVPELANEDALTGNETFYVNDESNDDTDNVPNYTLDSRLISGLQNGSNTLLFRFPDEIQALFDATPNTGDRTPFWRLSRLKLENHDLLDNSGAYNRIAPGYAFDIDAFVYAQTGSWMIIPGNYFDPTIRFDATSSQHYVDLNHSESRDPGEGLDLNRDGQLSPEEAYTIDRFYRYNYQINFVGAIMEKQTAHIQQVTLDSGTLPGAVDDWMSKWATVTREGNNPATHSNITYTYDPTLAADPAANYDGLHLPVAPGLMYQTG